MTKLTGAKLLDCVKKNKDADKETLLEAAGYFSTRSDGSKSFSPTVVGDFYQNLLRAQGLEVAALQKSSSGRSLPYKTTVMTKGQCLLGKGYLIKEGFKPSDKFRVETKDGAIKLTFIEN